MDVVSLHWDRLLRSYPSRCLKPTCCAHSSFKMTEGNEVQSHQSQQQQQQQQLPETATGSSLDMGQKTALATQESGSWMLDLVHLHKAKAVSPQPKPPQASTADQANVLGNPSARLAAAASELGIPRKCVSSHPVKCSSRLCSISWTSTPPNSRH